MGLKEALEKSIESLGKEADLPTMGSSFSTGDISAWIPSGITPLDIALGGGLPLGRMSELYSREESEGKSTLCIHFAVQCQMAGGVVVWLESEAALDKARAVRMGLDLEKVVIYGPPTVEDGFAFIRNMIRNIKSDEDLESVPVLVVWDTIAAAPTKAEKEEDNEYGEGIARKPRIISNALHDLTLEFFKCKVHLIMVNQTYTTFSRFGPGYSTPGGKAIKFHASIRLELYKSGVVEDDNGQPVGIQTTFFVKKNKLALPHRKGTLILYGERGYSNIMSMAQNFIDMEHSDMLKQGGGWYSLCGGDVKCRWKDLLETVKKSPSIFKAWQEKFLSIWPLPPGRGPDPKNGWIVPVK